VFDLDAAALRDDRAADALRGQGGLDWFLAGAADMRPDRTRRERLTGPA
jgi:hypothetical protein